MRKLALLLLLAATVVSAQEPLQELLKGTLCFDKDCTAVSGTSFDVKPADADRRFVWTSSDGATFVLGRLKAKETKVTLDQPERQTVTLSINGDVRHSWPLETQISVMAGRDAAWRMTMPAKLAGKPLKIRVPRGMYGLAIVAPHHRGDRRQLRADRDVDLANITLAPLPSVTGRVVTMKKSDDDAQPKEIAIAGASLSGSNGKVLGTSNEQGAFRVELPEPFTKELVVVAPGYATQVLPLNVAASDVDAGTIKLGAGVKLAVHLDRADSAKSAAIRARLTRHSATQYENTVIETRDIKASEDDLVFADLSEGEYYLTLSGSGPLEFLTTTIPVKSEDVARTIRIAPFQVAGTVRLGTDPVTDGNVGIHDSNHTWTADATLDSSGNFGGTMWQRENLGAWVQSKVVGTLPIDGHVTLTGDPASWDIAFTKRLLTGRIFDEETKEPLANARLSYQFESREKPTGPGPATKELYSGADVAPDGTFSIVALQNGVFDLTATAPDRIPEKVTVEFVEGDEAKKADMPMARGVAQVIEVVWPNGSPAPGATMIEGLSRDGHNPLWIANTDGTGTIRVRMRPDESKTLFVIPREGSFAPIRIASPGQSPKPMRVTVPPPVGSLLVHTVDSDKMPAPAALMIRFNGEALPYSVSGRLHLAVVAPGTYRISLLPAGAYEVWGVGRREGTFSLPPREPARIGLSSGEQTVEVVVPK